MGSAIQMQEATSHEPGKSGRHALAQSRLPSARQLLSECGLCAHACGVDRSAEPAGLCHAGPATRVFGVQVDLAEELEFLPTFAISFSGCNLRCAFCVTGAESWDARAGQGIGTAQLARQARRALAEGCQSVMVLGGEPTVHLPFLIELVAALPDNARLILKTNGYVSSVTREQLKGLFDVWCVDFKFGNDDCARRLARISDYPAVLRDNLLWASAHTELVVRHLLMPGHFECCWRPVAEWLGSNLGGTKVSLRTGFWPAWQAGRHAELRGPVSLVEAHRAEALAHDLGLNLIH